MGYVIPVPSMTSVILLATCALRSRRAGERTWSGWNNLLTSAGVEGGNIVAHECALHGLSGDGGCGRLGDDREGRGFGGECALRGGGKGGLPQHCWAHDRSHFNPNSSTIRIRERGE